MQIELEPSLASFRDSRAVGPAEAPKKRAFDRVIDTALHSFGPLRVQSAYHKAQFRKAGLTERFIELPEARVHAWVSERRHHDTRTPLVLLHGFGADAEQQWAGQVRELAERHLLIVPDLLFFGESEARRPDPHLDYQVETLLALLDRLCLERVHMLGISYGGLCAIDLASRFGGRVSRLVLSNSPGPVMTGEDHAAMLDRLGVEEMADLLVPRDPTEIGRLLRIAWHRPPPVPGLAMRDAFNRYFTARSEERREVMRALTARIGDPELLTRTVENKTLILWGEHDQVFTTDLAHRLRDFIGHAELRIFSRTAHAPNQERPRDFNRAVLRFLMS